MEKNIRFEVITDLEKAKEAWEELSLHRVIDDEWDFRYTFIKTLNYPLHFIAGYENETLIGLLALQKNTLEGLMPPYDPKNTNQFYEFFGGDDTDDNRVLIKEGYSDTIPLFLAQAPRPTYLAPLAEAYTYEKEAEFYTNRYHLPLQGFKDYEEYLQATWGKSSRKKMRQQVRGLYRDHTIEVIQNNYDDIERLVELNQERFDNTSSFSFPYRKEIFRELASTYQAEMLTVVVDGKKEAVSYGIKYKDLYLGMNAGVNSAIPDLGKLLVLLQINRAIELGCIAYDGGKGSGVWKEEFKFEKIPQYKLSIE